MKTLWNFFNSKLQKGSALVFFALMLPVLFLFIGAAADFGWLYLNQSRLQNAADSAVTAAARALTSRDGGERTYSFFVSNFNERLDWLVSNGKIVSASDLNTNIGDVAAIKYAKINLKGFLGNDDLKIVDVNNPENASVPDAFNTIKFKRVVYGPDPEDNDAIYYVVVLSERLQHLFDVIDKFDIQNLNSRAMAVVKIAHTPVKKPPHDISLYQQMKALIPQKTYSHWWDIQKEFTNLINKKNKQDEEAIARLADYTGVTSADDMARMRSVQAKGNEYITGNFYRTETLTLHGWSQAANTNGTIKGNKMDQRNFDNLFVDFKADIKANQFDNDPASTEGTGYNLDAKNANITDATVLKYRIHDLINIGKWNASTSTYTYEYQNRPGKESTDPLYIRIESEDNYVDGNVGNTVRQIIINVNVANTGTNDRPIFFFYDGPQKAKSLNGNTTYGGRGTR